MVEPATAIAPTVEALETALLIWQLSDAATKVAIPRRHRLQSFLAKEATAVADDVSRVVVPARRMGTAATLRRETLLALACNDGG